MTKIITPNKKVILPGAKAKVNHGPLDITTKLVPDTTNIGKTKVLVSFNTPVSWLTLAGDQAAQLGFKLIQQETIAQVTNLTPVAEKEEENEKTV